MKNEGLYKRVLYHPLFTHFKQKLFLLNYAIVLTLLLTCNVTAKSYSQGEKIDLSIHGVALKEVLPMLEQKGKIRLMYSEEGKGLENLISIDVRDTPVLDVLAQLLENSGLQYRELKSGLFVILGEEDAALQNPVKGSVRDGDGQPLAGVSVLVAGSDMGTTTNAEGQFTINVPENGTLILSYVGYLTQEVPVNAQTTIEIVLEEDSYALSEVVVIGYGTTTKSDLTGSVSSVSAEDIEKMPVTTVDQALQGRSAGVQVMNNDGSPGADISVQIRGVGSFGNTAPLYVVDGYPISGGLASINPADIQSIDILKDASAAAIYGNRASNGVVIITTKRGSSAGGVQISIDANTSIQSEPERYSMMTAEQFVTAAKTVVETDNYNALQEWIDNPASSFRNIDWQDAFYKTGLRQNYSLALRGGGTQVQSAFSLGYFKHDGIVKFSGFERYNAGLNLDYTPFSWLKATTSIKYTHSNRDGRAANLGSFLFLIPTMTGRPGVDQIKDENGIYGYYTLGQQATGSGQTNLYADLEQRQVDRPSNYLLTTAALEATLLPGLKAKTNLGVNTSNFSSLTFNPANDRSLNAPLSSFDQSVSTTAEWLWENTLSYAKTFGQHTVDVVGGISAQQNKFRMSGVNGNGSISNDVISGSNGNLTVINSTTGFTELWSLASQFGRLTYKFADKYIFTGTIRRDGSSRFGDGQKWGIFPSLSVAWRLKEEGFLHHVDAISDLKLRASWGKAGNQDVPLFAYQGPYTPGPSANDNRGYVFGEDKAYYPGLVLDALPNPNLTWEKNTQTDIGLDLSLFNNRIHFTADYYKRVSSDFLLNVDVPAQTGFSAAQRNVGEMQNEGFELAVQYRNDKNPFKWSIGINGSTIKNTINSYAEGLTQMYNQNQLGFRNYGGNQWTQYSLSRVGGVIGAFYGFKTDGIFQDREEIDALNTAAEERYGEGAYYQVSTTSPGDRKFVDLNGDGRITDDDRTIIGNPLPKFFGGLTFDGSYRQFDFSVFVYASIGNDILNYARRNLENFDAAAGVGLQNFGTDFYENHWTPENRSTTYPRLVAYDQNGNNRVSDAYVEDGSFARLKNVQVGYTLPEAAARSLHMSRLRIYVSAQNLFTITNYSGLDPEIGNTGAANGNNANATGVDLGNYPTSQFFTLGLNVGF